MNDLEYLNQISASANANAPKPGLLGLLDKKMKIVIGILAGVILLLIILVAASSSRPEKSEATDISELGRLYTRSVSLSKTISKYNRMISRPSIRSTGSSFSTLLEEISSKTKSYLTGRGVDTGAIVATADDAAKITELEESLEQARLNGSEILDRRYASEMFYQIRFLIIIEDSIIKKTTDADLKSYLESSKESAYRLGDSFYNFYENQ